MNRKIVLSAFVSALLLSTVFGTIWLSGPITSATPTTWTVDDDRIQCPDADFITIQEAIDSAKDGDIIEVCNGFYKESIVIDKQITLIGVHGSHVTTIDAGWTKELQVVTIKSSNVRVENFSIQHTYLVGLGAGIRLQSRLEKGLVYGIVIHKNNISNVHIGIDCGWSKSIDLHGSMITENAILFTPHRGIYLSNGTDLLVSRNIIEYVNGTAIHMGDVSHTEISGNYIRNSTDGLELEKGNNNNITGNTFIEIEKWGIIVGSSYNNVSDNMVTSHDGILINGNSSNICNNTVKGGRGFGFYVRGVYNDIDSNIIMDGWEYGILSWKLFNNFTNNTIQNANTGIECDIGCSSGNQIKNCSVGIHIPFTGGNATIFNNFFHDCEEGVRVEGNFSNIDSNTFVNNYVTNGIELCGCYNNTITRNLFLHSNYSICLLSASFNNITENTISSSVRFIDSYNSQYNLLCNNDVFDVTSPLPCCEEASANEYMNNYWDDYSGIDKDGDGYGDERYRVATTQTYDNSPRDVPYRSFPILWRDIEFHCRVLGNLVVSNICFDHSSGCLQFKITVPDSAESPSRYNKLIIPRRILDGHFKVMIDDTVIPSILSWNDTHTSIYFTYIEKGIHNVKVIGEIVTKVPITEITEFPDINRDGVINILDVATAAGDWFGKALEEYYRTKNQQD